MTLIEKVKIAISKSGFPLELTVGNKLEEGGWDYTIGNIFHDFETGKYRESDIVARKIINGVAVEMYIECKKSDEKQLILYAPTNRKNANVLKHYLKLFPQVRHNQQNYSVKNVFEEFEGLPIFNMTIPLSKTLIVSKGDRITEDNVNYVSSINGALKNCIDSISLGTYTLPERSLYLYLFVFDGQLFQLTNSKTEPFELNEVTYGIYQYQPNFQVNITGTDKKKQDLFEAIKAFRPLYYIEVITPDSFGRYLDDLNNSLMNINQNQIIGWGQEARDFLLR